MSHTALIIAVSYLIVVVIGSVIALAVWRSTRQRVSDGAATETFAHREKVWFGIVVVALRQAASVPATLWSKEARLRDSS